MRTLPTSATPDPVTDKPKNIVKLSIEALDPDNTVKLHHFYAGSAPGRI
jgi:hypothetical protein